MKIESKKRALDKIYKRRDRYEIPDWQREEVWDETKKQELIDSILRRWKLPKFYFLKTDDDPEEFDVVDGQQRLTAIFEFFDNALTLSQETSDRYKNAIYYGDLPSSTSDEFDDFEIEYDEITEATEEEIKLFFQRLQQGLPLTSSEKLNAVHSQLRNYCRELAKHSFFRSKVSFANKRYAYFDVISKAAAIEIEGLDASLRFSDLKELFESNSQFSSNSVVARRLKGTLGFLDRAFSIKSPALRNRSIVQSVFTLAAAIYETGRSFGTEEAFAVFVSVFVSELSRQVELGLDATDEGYLLFQRSVSANVRGGARTRHEIMLRKLLRSQPLFVNVFGPSAVAEGGLAEEVRALGISVSRLVEKINIVYSAKNGTDLIKPTNKTVGALQRLTNPIQDLNGYRDFISDAYFIFKEGPGVRLKEQEPASFRDINILRTDAQHDVDHGDSKAIAKKRKSISIAYRKYISDTTPVTTAPEHFPLFQANLLAAIEDDLRQLLTKYS